MHTTSPLRMMLFGPPRVVWNGNSISIPRRQVRALLFRLAFDLKPVSFDYLCYLFWPDVPPATARRRLTHLHSHLRTVVPRDDLVIAADDHIALNPDLAWSDSAAMQELFAYPNLEERIDLLLESQRLYAGRFLDGFSVPSSSTFDHWVCRQQKKLENDFLSLLDKLISKVTGLGEIDRAISLCRAYLEIDELAEDIHGRLIELYSAKGDMRAADGQYQQCLALLQSELGVEPIPETHAAHQLLQNGHSDMLSAASAGALSFRAVPVIGREKELRLLMSQFQGALRGIGGFSFIYGESGVGKSRLIDEFVKKLPESTVVLRSYCYSGTQEMPYFPLLDIVQGKRVFSDDDHSMLIKVFADAYSSRSHRTVTDLMRVDELRMRIYDALCQMLRESAAGQSLILCLEDLQWADDATIDWLAYWGRQIRDQQACVIASYCCAGNHEIRSLANKLRGMRIPVQEIPISGLVHGEARALLNCLTEPAVLPESVVELIWNATNGNPLYLIELGRAIAEGRSYISISNDSMDSVPASVQQSIELRLAQLSPLARQILEVISILAFGDFASIRRVSGRTPAKTAQALEELVDRFLLAKQGPYYRFRHKVVQEVVLSELSPVRLELLIDRAQQSDCIVVHPSTILAMESDDCEEAV